MTVLAQNLSARFALLRDGLHLDDGRIVQRLYLESGLTGVPAISGPHLYLFDHLGFLYSFTAI